MADITVNILTPATSTDLLTLDEAKLWLGISLTDTSQDAIIQSMITTFSEEIAERANRHPTVTFGYEEVSETWRETMNGRLYLTHWPVKAADIISISVGSGLDVLPVGGYELGEAAGKLSNIQLGGAVSASWNHPVTVHYWGGYNVPTETPLPLKRAAVLLIREERIRMVQAQAAGVRQISHKGARVSFFDPNELLLRSVGAKSPTLTAVESILTHYMRFPV
jgi:hypothetical protein